ncbi:MAG TPA: hypothetical protein VLD15_01165 [Burkholderiales bacterium]|nr:hypothetical protein [Burkholderiales bacterium]
MRRGLRGCITAVPLSGLPLPAWSHAFGERYDLPAPLGYFVAGAAAAVALSFVVAAVFVRAAPRDPGGAGLVVPLGPLLPPLRPLLQVLSVLLLALVVAAGFLGSRSPEMNLAPVLVWIVWWVGVSFLVACVGNIWAALDPWRALYEGMDALARRMGLANGISLGRPYPQGLGIWPAVVLLMTFVWIEVVYPRAAVPSHVAWLALAWSAITLSGMVYFGAGTWRRNADVFAIYFGTIARFAPLDTGDDGRSIVVRPPGRGLITAGAASFGVVGFVIAMLSTVMFDGLLGTQAMTLAHAALADWMTLHPLAGGYVLGTAGIVGVWLFFLAAYWLACAATARIVGDRPAGAIARLFVLTLVPIAIAYSVAHYFHYLLVQGQLIVPLLSDPLGRSWDLFGTASYYPDIGLLDARFVWNLALASIVAGHVISIWLAHRVALREFGARGRAVAASVPLTVLMVIYTVVSLLIVADPLVQYGVSDRSY